MTHWEWLQHEWAREREASAAYLRAHKRDHHQPDRSANTQVPWSPGTFAEQVPAGHVA